MDSLEAHLYKIITEQYGSVRNFANHISMAQSTIDSILKRGIYNSSVTSLIKICNELKIDIELLAQGKVVSKLSAIPVAKLADAHKQHEERNATLPPLHLDAHGIIVTNDSEISLIKKSRELNEAGAEKLNEYIDDLLDSDRYVRDKNSAIIWRAARSHNNTESEIIHDGQSTIEKLKKAKPDKVTSTDDF